MAGDTPVQLEKTRINLFNAVGFTVVIAGNVAAASVAWTTYKNAIEGQDKRIIQLEQRADNADNFRVARSTTTDKAFADLNAKVELMQNLPYRMGSAETAIVEQGKRIDRLSETMLNAIDNLRNTINQGNEQIRKDLNVVGTKVEVLGSRLDASRPQRSSFP